MEYKKSSMHQVSFFASHPSTKAYETSRNPSIAQSTTGKKQFKKKKKNSEAHNAAQALRKATRQPVEREEGNEAKQTFC